ncbi:unnamed protein product [Albugo candida]|uniref:Uncharacterized protein n=1 Tax=Albugo candida TaxID=65357 RepID=A0A024FZA7_9STRA|nr:unnamed protein product [Albugo candida]|eukprot:CCI39894.1 unnamed protein product [Albugo candida]
MTFSCVQAPTFSLNEHTPATRRVSCSSLRGNSYRDSLTSDLEENALLDIDNNRSSIQTSKASLQAQSPSPDSRQQLCNPFHRLTLRSTKSNPIVPVTDENSNPSSRTSSSSSSSLQLSDDDNDTINVERVVVLDSNDSSVSDGDDIALLEDAPKPSFSGLKRDKKRFSVGRTKLRDSIIDDSLERKTTRSTSRATEDECRSNHFFVPDVVDISFEVSDCRISQSIKYQTGHELAEEFDAGATVGLQHWDLVVTHNKGAEKNIKAHSRHSTSCNGVSCSSWSDLEAVKRSNTTASISRLSEQRRRPHNLVANQCIYLTFKTRFRDVYGQVSSHKNRLSSRVTCFPLSADDLHHPEKLESDTGNLFHINAHTIDGQLRGGDCVVLARSDGMVLRTQSITRNLVFSRREDSKSKFIISGIRDGMLVGNTMPFYLVSVCDRTRAIGFLQSTTRFGKKTFGWLAMCPTRMRREEARVVEPIYFLQRILV